MSQPAVREPILIQKRRDAVGLFWQDWVVKKEPAPEKPKRVAPERTWERDDYLPGLDEALAFNVDLFTDEELLAAAARKERLVFDIEDYPNYFLIAFRSIESGKIVYFEMDENGACLHLAKLHWVMHNFTIIGFNSTSYDMPVAALALAGKGLAALMQATENLIVFGHRPGDVLRAAKVKALKDVDHIDLIEVAPLRASLKIYSGRLHAQRMQDLPFAPGKRLSPEQIAITRLYCCNDLANTALLYRELEEAIHLRESMSKDYGVDLRSRSDAQVAEAVIAHEIHKLNGQRPGRPEIVPGTRYRYNIPAFIQYASPTMQWVLERVRHTNFVVAEDGTIGMPPELADLEIPIAGGVYRMGIGGLHSSEKKVAHYANDNVLLVDRDVASYYPRIILNQGLYPKHLGINFLRVYQKLVDMRLHAKEMAKQAKKAGDKEAAAHWSIIQSSLKITINGSFGKLGSPYSVLYAPDLLIQVTITGQLALLMLIERCEMADIPVVSGNTDGIVIKCPIERKAELDAVVAQWERDTSFETEETQYKAVFSRDVNNYFAVKKDGGDPKGRYLDQRLGVKVKGVYCERGSAQDSRLSKNPSALICSDAVLRYLADGTPIVRTVRDCQDITRFVSVRSVTGGAVKNGVYLGKSIRWYYSTEEKEGEIVYAKNGNKVPRSDGAKPLMDLPSEFPKDVDYDWYIEEAEKILREIGYMDAAA